MKASDNNQLINLKKRFGFHLFIFTWLSLLYLYYLNPVHPLYFYININEKKLLVAVAIVAVFAYVLPKTESLLLLILESLYFVIIMPSLVLFWLDTSEIKNEIYKVLGFFTFVACSQFRQSWNMPKNQVNEKAGLIVLIFLWCLMVSYISITNLSNFSSLNFFKFYEIRLHAEKMTPSLITRSLSIFIFGIMPFLLSIALQKRKTPAIVGSLLLSFLSGFAMGKKIYIYMPFIVMGIFFICRQKKIINALYSCACLVLACCSIEIYLNKFDLSPRKTFLSDQTIRRALFVPVKHTNEYLKFFEKNPFNLWSNSKITLGLLGKKYEKPIPEIIGDIKKPGSYANVGFVGSGFAEAGFLGIIIYAIGLGIFLSVIIHLAQRTGSFVPVSSSFVMLLTGLHLTNPILVGLSYGLLFLIPLLLFFKNSYSYTENDCHSL